MDISRCHRLLFSNKITLPTLKKVLVLRNSVEPDEMVFTDCESMHLGVTSKNRVKRLRRARGLMFGPSLHRNPYFVYTSRKGSGETAHLRRLI